jgi:sporulation protein YlmC with PRC-barrel domain
MRLSEVLGLPVVDTDGDQIGAVADVRLVQDGPVQASMQAAFRVDGLIVVEGHSTELFGYERHVGPALLRWLVHRRLGAVHYVPWASIDRVDAGAVRIRVPRERLTPLETMPRY